MLNKLSAFLREQQLVATGDRVIAALSGGADSVAMTFALYLLKDKLRLQLEAAHYNHHLRAEESDSDEAFVRDFCHRYDIPLHLGGGVVTPGKKGLEAAAREARYAFFRTLPGVVATAHTADDNAETVLLHLLRGTGLRGLGGIAPKSPGLIRPMLGVTRADVEAFLQEYCLPHREDSSNQTDAFLRNRLRHQVLPILREENPQFVQNTSRMALLLRREERCLSTLVPRELPDIPTLRALDPALRLRCLECFLKESGVPEPELSHLLLAEQLVFSQKPSAAAAFPGGVTIARNYQQLQVLPCREDPVPQPLVDGVVFGDYRIRVEAEPAPGGPWAFAVAPEGAAYVRSRCSGDRITRSGGTKTLKKLFIDCKIPAAQRSRIPVIVDDRGVLGVCGIGENLARLPHRGSTVTVRFERIKPE